MTGQWPIQVFFLLLSGVSVTLGSHPVKRGLLVIAGGILCSLAIYFLYRIGSAPRSIIIYFGILHCIGTCMLLWPLFRKIPFFWALALLGAAILFLPRLIGDIETDSLLLLPFGIYPRNWVSSDYFPLIPNLGYF